MHFTGLLADPRFWVLVAFTIFFALFGRRLWAILAAMLDKRAADVRAALDEASRLRAEAEAMLHDAERRRADAIEDSRHLIENARAQAARLTQTAAAEAEASAKRREQMTRDRIAAAEKAAIDEVRVAAAEIATDAARAVIARALSAESGATLIDTAIDNLPRALRAA